MLAAGPRHGDDRGGRELADRQVLGAELVGEPRGEPEPEAAGLAVEHDRVDAVAAQLTRHGGRAADGVGAARRPPVGDDDEQGAPVRVAQPLDAQRVVLP